MIKNYLILLCLFVSLQGFSQSLVVESFKANFNDLTARVKERKDLNGNPCALIKVELPIKNVLFEGNVVGDVEWKKGEYWVYVPQGTRNIKIKSDIYRPLSVDFTRYNSGVINGNSTYILSVKVPQSKDNDQATGNYLIINVLPKDADVKVDGVKCQNIGGDVSCYLDNGSHSVLVEKEGYAPVNKNIEMNGVRMTEKIVLNNEFTWLTVTTGTKDARIYVNGAYKGKNSWKGSLLPQKYVVESRKDGYKDEKVIIELSPKDIKSIKIPEMKPEYGVLKVDFQPTNCDIMIDGKNVGKTPNVISRIQTGTHEVTIRKNGFPDWSRRVDIKPGVQNVISGKLGERTVSLDALASMGNNTEQNGQTNNSLSAECIENSVVRKIIENMVFVKGGSYMMGSASGEAGKDEKPVHKVILSDFYICKYEVTQEEWEELMGSNPSKHIGNNLPVEMVNKEDCQKFIDRLNAITGLTFRLPTEAEWEYAARGGNQSVGRIFSGSNIATDVAWVTGNSESKSHAVGQRQANELGLYDMSGNVKEWCADIYYEKYYKNSPEANPINEVVRKKHNAGTVLMGSLLLGNPTALGLPKYNYVVRGGCFADDATMLRVSARDCNLSLNKSEKLGLRLVCDSLGQRDF